MKSLLKITFLITLLSACSGEKSSLKFSAPKPQNLTGETDFNSIKTAILIPDCIRCHVQYESYESVKEDLQMIVNEIESDRMPKNQDPLSEQKKDFLRKWVAAGAPEGSITQVDNQKISWSRISKEILGPKCIQCHNPNGQASFLDLSTRDAIWNKRAEILNFETPSESYLMTVIKDSEELMPPVWSGLERLSDEEVATLEEWIGKGIP